jgi:hypothetical protein
VIWDMDGIFCQVLCLVGRSNYRTASA